MIKRLFDIAVSLLILVAFAPLLPVVSLAVLFFLGRPIFFVQQRPGLKGRPFRLIKFRTMRKAVNHKGVPLPDAERLTTFGRFLRKSSLDELPELWNVLRGDMSLVGPRPLLMEYLPLYTAEQMRRHDVRPGITGWAQVNGRNNLAWDALFALDVWYVDNRSFWLDVKILLLTVKTVVSGAGVSQSGHVTRTKFRGDAQ